MGTEKFNDVHINKLRKEYKRIDNDWLVLHYKISIGLVLFALLVECFMGVVLINSDMLTTTVSRYIWKFIVAPSGFNFICIGIDTMVMKAKRFSQNQKMYTVSIIFVFICLILFTAHNAFTATCFMFAAAIILTTIYADYRITFVTALVSIVALVVSELFGKWDIDKISIFDSTLQMGNFLISLFILIACSMVCMVEIGFERKKNEASIQMEIEQLQLKQRLQLDELTGIFNRKALHDAMEDMEGKVSDNNYILTIADIDNFKSINDHLGHHVGDYCLKEFAKVLGENCGKATIFRYGGDEFCLLFCNADINEAVSVCEQIQLKLSNLHFEPHAMLKMTASFGLAEYSDQVNTTRLFIHADQALYEAKEVRNNICVFQPKVKSME